MRTVGTLVGVTLIGCGETPAEPVGDLLPDGDYSISLSDPTITSPNTPGWVLNEPMIDFTKSGDNLNVTGSTNDIASTGQPDISQILADNSWNVLFPVSPSVSGNEGSVWTVNFTASQCIKAAAFGPGIPLIGGIPMQCSIARR